MPKGGATKKNGGVKPAVEYARQLFLYGNGDGQRIVNTAKLVELSGLHEQTILKHIPAWQKESERILASTSEIGLAIRLSSEAIDAHEKDQAFIREKMNSIKWEIENLEDSIASLEGICDNFSLNTDNGDAAIRLFEGYLRASQNKRSLLTLFLTLKKEWDEKSAIDGLRDVALVRERELTKGRVKLDLKKESAQPQDARPAIGGGVFNRPVRNIEAGES